MPWPPDKRKPPARDRRLSQSVLLGGFDFSEDKHPQRISQPRLYGPGERARTRELRRRKLHLRLIEAWRP